MDITDDNLHATLLHICKKGNAPYYVLSAKPMNKEAAAELPSSLFADRANRRYPIDSKANTWLSAGYFAKTAEEDGYSTTVMKDLVESTIKLAADKYGIREDVDNLMKTLREKPIEKSASDDLSNYGYPEEKKYPMFDEKGVKLASSYFEENAYKYPAPMRKEIATNILNKCAEYSIEPTDMVRREAGKGFNLREDVMVELADRVKASSHNNVKLAEAMTGAIKTLMALPMDAYQNSIEKFAQVMDHIDESLGFADSYGTRFRSPMEIFHGRNIKEAQEKVYDTVEIGPNCFSVQKLSTLPIEVFTDALGDDFGDRVKTAEAIDTNKLSIELHSMSEPNRNALYRSIVVYTM